MSRATYEWARLPAGPRLAVSTLPAAECVAVTIHIPAGSRDEENQHAGLAHFVEHMTFKGTARRDARCLSLALEDAGCQANACTSEDQTVYDGRGEADALPVLADLLCDMVWHSTFPEPEIELERDVIGEEITMVRETPSDHIGDLISAALWGGHPLGHPLSGTEESISRLDAGILRGFRDCHHFREDVVISVSGPFAWKDVANLFSQHVPECRSQAIPLRPFHRSDAAPGLVEETRGTDQVQLSLAWHTPGRMSPDRHPLRLLSLIFAESAGSRLFLELREELGLCYQVSSDVTLFADTGAFEIHAGLAPDSEEEAFERILRHAEDLARNGPSRDELNRSRRLAVAQTRMAMETTSAHAFWAGECILDHERVLDPGELREDLLAVTADDVQRVACDLFLAQRPSVARIRPA